MSEHKVSITNPENSRVNEEQLTVMVGEDEYILDALEEAGHDLPYSCREGMCTSCVARVIEGEFHREGSALDPTQKGEFVLICSATPESDCQIEIDCQDELFDGPLSELL
jgi:ferredoxin